MVLRHLEELGEVESATALGCSVGNVKSLTSRGLAKLRAELTQGTVAHPSTRAETRDD